MKFMISASALNLDGRSNDLIDRLIDRASDLVHKIEFLDPDLVVDSNWYQTARMSRRRLAMAAAAAAPRNATDSALHAKIMCLNSREDIDFAVKTAYAPLIVLVEDSESDGALVDLIVQKLGTPELVKFWRETKAVTPRAYVFQTAGGLGAMPVRVRRAVSDAAEEGRSSRIIVICDSDRRWAGGDASLSQQSLDDLSTLCQGSGIRLHILEKRSAENYIPDEVFQAWRDDPSRINNKHRFEAFLRRTSAQRDYFPIKDGLSDAEFAEATRAQLYTAADTADALLLKERLFPKRPRVLRRLLDSNGADFTARGLRSRDGKSELSALLDLIAGEL